MSEVVYRSKVRVERQDDGVRRAILPAEPEPTLFGIHDEIAAHYGKDPGPNAHAATLDYIVAAAAG